VCGTSWRIIVLLMGYAALGHFNRLSITVAGDELFIPNKGITEPQMGWVYTTLLIVYTIAMLPAGWLIDRVGSGRILTLFGLTMGLFAVLTGVQGWFAESPHSLWISLLVIRGLVGLCNAPLHPGAAHVVSEVMPVGQRAYANGLITAGAVVGVACCYPAFGWLMETLSWQWAFIAGGLALMAYSLLWRSTAEPLLSVSERSRTVSTTGRESTRVLPVEAKAARRDAEKNSSDGSGNLSLLLESRDLWLLTLSYAAYGYFQYLLLHWQGFYFKEVLQISPTSARAASFWITLSMGAGMAFGGRITDIAGRRLGLVRGRRSVVLTGMGLGAVFGVAAVNVDSFVAVAVCMGISMAAVGLCEGVFWTTATEIGGQSGGLSGAFMNTGGNLGGLISPVLSPVMAESIGWPNSIAVACLISAIGGAVWLLITPPIPIPETESQ